MSGQTKVSINGEKFYINGEPTYKGRVWNGHQIEGLLLNSRMVQGIFDDLNPETRSYWAYPDTDEWDADRNTNEFIDAMPLWLAHGVLAFTINLQGGSPYGYSDTQPWINSAIEADGSLRDDYMARLERILNRADELGMVVILGIFYFGQEKVLDGENAIKQAVSNTVNWLLDKGYTNVIIEINNECDVPHYEQPILKPERVHELIELAKQQERDGRRILAGTSFVDGVPTDSVVKVSDFLLLHGNAAKDPAGIPEMIQKARQIDSYQPMPILFNEDDHFDFEKPMNNFIAAISEYASWGFFDYRMQVNKADHQFQSLPDGWEMPVAEEEGFDAGYQSVPVNWGISSERKKGFFDLAKQISGV